jgi:sec-independent protein translocase protein TatB
MFGMGFMEIFLILIVAVMALGPEKLPSAAVDMVKFFKKFKSGLDDAKSTLDSELNISQMREEANRFQASINEVKGIASVDLDDLTSLDNVKQDKKEKNNTSDEKTTEKETINTTNNSTTSQNEVKV